MTGLTMDPATLAEVLLRTGVKGAVLLGALVLLTRGLRRASAAGRHLAWFLGTVGLLALPFLETAAPDWRIPLPPGLSRAVGAPEAGAVEARAEVAASGAGAAALAVAPGVVGGGPGGEGIRDDGVESAPSPTSPVLAGSKAPARPFADPAATSPLREAGGEASGSRTGLLALVIWALGVGLLLTALTRSVLAVRRLALRAGTFPGDRVSRVADEVAARLGVRRPVRLLRGAAGAMPMAFGIRRPTILLPAGAEGWPASRLVAVILHEMAHVRRRDALTQVLAEVARALHWFDPLAWFAVARMRVEREHACDDRVLSAGARPSEYADELLSLARSFRVAPGTGLVAPAMGRPGDLRRRLYAVLADGRRRRLSRRDAGYAVTAVTLPALVLAALTPATGRRTGDPAPAPADADGGLRGALETPWPVAEASRQPPQEATCGMAATGWESTSYSTDDDRHRLEWRRDGCQVEVRVEGDVQFSDDFRDVARLGGGALLRIQEEEGRTERRLDVTPGPGGAPAYAYRVDGRDSPFDAVARAWFEGMLLQVFRRGGFMAGERVQSLLDQGGVEAVLQELDVLEADHVFAVYVQELLSRADLDEDQVVDLLGRARVRVDSDHYLAGILEAAANGRPLTDRILDATLAASEELDSDHYRAEVLGRVLERGELDAGRVGAVLASASEMESDHYLAEILTGVAERYALDPAMRTDYLRAVRSLESDHYRAQVLSGLLADNDLSDEGLAAVLQAAESIESDHYLAGILEEVGRNGLTPGALQDAYFEAARSIESDHYRQAALTPLVDSPDLSDQLLRRVLQAVARMDSDHYKAQILVEITQRHPPRGDVRQAFLGALESIASSHYRGQVSEALVRAGG